MTDAQPTVVYVISCYPAISHTFIQREIAALRRLGMVVHTVSLRASQPTDILTAADRQDLACTLTVLTRSPRDLLRVHLKALRASPKRYLQAAALAVSGARGLHERTRRLGHFVEAVIVWRHCQQLGAKHLHAHFERPAADVAMLAATLGGGCDGGWSWSFTAHSPTQYLGEADRLALKVSRARFVACVSYFGRSQLMMLVDHDQWDKLKIVRCGVDANLFRPRSGPVESDPCILTVARLAPLKGHPILLEALALMRQRGSAARAVWIGDGPERARLEDLARRLGVLSRVDFVGSLGQDVIRDRYDSADVFCLPSFVEGVPVVLMEAMAMGIPVVASRITGIPELVEDGRSGLLVNPGSPADLAAALTDILGRSPAQRAAMGAAGRARVKLEFDCDHSARTLRRLFREGPPAPAAPC